MAAARESVEDRSISIFSTIKEKVMNWDEANRRDFVKLGVLGVAGLYAAGGDSSNMLGAPAKKRPGIALQLYSIRKDCEKDLPGCLAAVEKMGYKGVEFAGYYGRTAPQLQKLLDENQLKCVGTHIALDTMLGNKLKETIEFNQILGNNYLICPWMPEERRKDRAGWLQCAKLFNEISDQLKPHGMKVGYHNHNFEFKPLGGEAPWDTFFGNTNQEVIMQFDTGNAVEGGGDALPFLKKYPGRAITVHMKEYSKSNPDALIGEGEMKWKELFQTCETIAATEWYIIEQESGKFSPMECVAKCYTSFVKLMG
jgi:sugar phosphate isomerase/epimerase